MLFSPEPDSCTPKPVPRSSPFMTPAQPALRVGPPASDAWLPEVKFDRYRCQLHKARDYVIIFSKNGREFTNRRFQESATQNSLCPASALSSMAKWWPARGAARPISVRCTPAIILRRSSASGASTSCSSMARIYGHFRSSPETKAPGDLAVSMTTLRCATPSRSRTASSSSLNAASAGSRHRVQAKTLAVQIGKRYSQCQYQFLPSICGSIGTSGINMTPRSAGFGMRSLSSCAPKGQFVAKVWAPLELTVRLQAKFAALHESGSGTSRTCAASLDLVPELVE